MTNLTIAQYRQRIEEMSVEDIQKNIVPMFKIGSDG